MAKTKISDITEWTISIDRGNLKETLKMESGIFISRKGKTEDFFDFLINRINPGLPHYTHALVKGGFVGNEEGEVELECAKGLLAGGIVSRETADFLSQEFLNFLHPLRDEMYGTPIDTSLNVWDEGMGKRKCLNCQTEIGFGDFRVRNQKEIPKEDLEKIWKSPYVQLYCCSCFRKQERENKLFDKLVKKRERLLNKAYRINEKFGFLE